MAVSNHYGRIYVIATASSLVKLNYWNGVSWSGWQDISEGKAITGPIAVSYGTGGRVDIVGVASNKAWHKWYDGAWHSWWDMSGASPITGSVAVANRDGLIHVVGWAGGKAWLKWWNGGGWSVWQSLVSPVDGSLAIDNVGAVRGNTTSTHYGVHIVAMAGGSAWLRCWENSDDCNVSGWMGLGGSLAGPLAVTNQNAQIRIVGKNSGWTLLHKWRG